MTDAYSFIKESNRIEGIHREPSAAEMQEFRTFMGLQTVTLDDLQRFVSVYQPNARIRDQPGLDVQVGSHIAPLGGMMIRSHLLDLLDAAERTSEQAYRTHHLYETLHPFTDGNGRSGRMLWLWQMRDAPLGFLHTFYYQALRYGISPG